MVVYCESIPMELCLIICIAKKCHNLLQVSIALAIYTPINQMVFFRPDLFDFNELKPNQHISNLSHAFNIAEEKLGIAKLLDPEGE